MPRNKLSIKDQMTRHKICMLQKGDLVCINGRWRKIMFIHGWTICFMSYTNTWHKSKLAWYSIHSIWRKVEATIKENHDKPGWRKNGKHRNNKKLSK